MVTPIWQIQRELQYAQAREAYYNDTTRPIKTTVDQRILDKVVYTPLFIKVGTTVPDFAIQASRKSVAFFGGAAALGLLDTAAALEEAETAPRGFKPSMCRATVGDSTPTPVRAYNGTGRRYIKYSAPATGDAQSNYNAPISAGATPTIDELETKFAAIAAAKKTALGGYGKIYLEIEKYTKSGL